MRQGEIWLVGLDPTLGSEMQKTRPCVVLSSDAVGILPLKIVAPFTDFKPHYADVPWMVFVVNTPKNGLKKPSSIDLFQVRSVSTKRLVAKLGEISPAELNACKEAMMAVFE